MMYRILLWWENFSLEMVIDVRLMEGRSFLVIAS